MDTGRVLDDIDGRSVIWYPHGLLLIAVDRHTPDERAAYAHLVHDLIGRGWVEPNPGDPDGDGGLYLRLTTLGLHAQIAFNQTYVSACWYSADRQGTPQTTR